MYPITICKVKPSVVRKAAQRQLASSTVKVQEFMLAQYGKPGMTKSKSTGAVAAEDNDLHDPTRQLQARRNEKYDPKHVDSGAPPANLDVEYYANYNAGFWQASKGRGYDEVDNHHRSVDYDTVTGLRHDPSVRKVRAKVPGGKGSKGAAGGAGTSKFGVHGRHDTPVGLGVIDEVVAMVGDHGGYGHAGTEEKGVPAFLKEQQLVAVTKEATSSKSARWWGGGEATRSSSRGFTQAIPAAE
jgi:hypothetical protein